MEGARPVVHATKEMVERGHSADKYDHFKKLGILLLTLFLITTDNVKEYLAKISETIEATFFTSFANYIDDCKPLDNNGAELICFGNVPQAPSLNMDKINNGLTVFSASLQGLILFLLIFRVIKFYAARSEPSIDVDLPEKKSNAMDTREMSGLSLPEEPSISHRCTITALFEELGSLFATFGIIGTNITKEIFTRLSTAATDRYINNITVYSSNCRPFDHERNLTICSADVPEEPSLSTDEINGILLLVATVLEILMILILLGGSIRSYRASREPSNDSNVPLTSTTEKSSLLAVQQGASI